MAAIKILTSLQHPLVKHLVLLREDRKIRYQEKRVVIEGKKMISEASQGIKKLLVTEESLIPPACLKEEIYLVTQSIIEKISGARSPEGILAEVQMPDIPLPSHCSRLLILDGISDPGNLGALLRSALALGWEGAFILSGSCDPYNDKALRSAKGATFHLPLEIGSFERCKERIKQFNLKPLVATLKGSPVEEVVLVESIALILGSEARGPSKEMLALGKPITISMKQNVESLNVASAGAILMYALGVARK